MRAHDRNTKQQANEDTSGPHAHTPLYRHACTSGHRHTDACMSEHGRETRNVEKGLLLWGSELPFLICTFKYPTLQILHENDHLHNQSILFKKKN